ncbi:MAG: hypothetical protein MJZ20_09645 [Bacteroidaceae bacterium]|nr:hypothetical protein [Bacteroidaceae bacterium]
MAAAYTVSHCVLTEERRCYCLVGLFLGDNKPKIAIDSHNIIVDKYTQQILSMTDKTIRFGFLAWMDFMSKAPEKWLKVKIESRNDIGDDIFLKVCSATANKTLIVYDIDNCKWAASIKDGLYCFNNNDLKVIDVQDAYERLSNSGQTVINISPTDNAKNKNITTIIN